MEKCKIFINIANESNVITPPPSKPSFIDGGRYPTIDSDSKSIPAARSAKGDWKNSIALLPTGDSIKKLNQNIELSASGQLPTIRNENVAEKDTIVGLDYINDQEVQEGILLLI